MQSIIFNYEYEYNKILLYQDFGPIYKLDLFDLDKKRLCNMLSYFYGYGSPKVFPFNITIHNEYNSLNNIIYMSIYHFFSAQKFYDYISIQKNSTNNYSPWISDLWNDFEINKFIENWKKDMYQLDVVNKIEKIYNEIIIKNIIE